PEADQHGEQNRRKDEGLLHQCPAAERAPLGLGACQCLVTGTTETLASDAACSSMRRRNAPSTPSTLSSGASRMIMRLPPGSPNTSRKPENRGISRAVASLRLCASKTQPSAKP